MKNAETLTFIAEIRLLKTLVEAIGASSDEIPRLEFIKYCLQFMKNNEFSKLLKQSEAINPLVKTIEAKRQFNKNEDEDKVYQEIDKKVKSLVLLCHIFFDETDEGNKVKIINDILKFNKTNYRWLF